MRDVQGVFTLTTDQEERKHMNSTWSDSPRRSVETNLTAGTNHGQLHKLRAVRATGTVSTSAVTAQARAPLAERICERRAAAGSCRQKTLNGRIEGAGRTREAEGVRGLRPTHMLNHHKHAPGGCHHPWQPPGHAERLCRLAGMGERAAPSDSPDLPEEQMGVQPKGHAQTPSVGREQY